MQTSPPSTAKPTMQRSDLHPASNKAAAMSPSGDWLSYSEVPTPGENGWEKKPETVCFRISPAKAPDWQGDWKDSLVTFAE